MAMHGKRRKHRSASETMLMIYRLINAAENRFEHLQDKIEGSEDLAADQVTVERIRTAFETLTCQMFTGIDDNVRADYQNRIRRREAFARKQKRTRKAAVATLVGTSSNQMLFEIVDGRPFPRLPVGGLVADGKQILTLAQTLEQFGNSADDWRAQWIAVFGRYVDLLEPVEAQ